MNSTQHNKPETKMDVDDNKSEAPQQARRTYYLEGVPSSIGTKAINRRLRNEVFTKR